jgi:hypothetical protein
VPGQNSDKITSQKLKKSDLWNWIKVDGDTHDWWCNKTCIILFDCTARVLVRYYFQCIRDSCSSYYTTCWSERSGKKLVLPTCLLKEGNVTHQVGKESINLVKSNALGNSQKDHGAVALIGQSHFWKLENFSIWDWWVIGVWFRL